MTAIVTGAAGFVGSHVVDELLRQGKPVRALARTEGQIEELRQRGAEVVVGDVCNGDEVASALYDAAVVYHCAAAVGHGLTKKHVYDVNLGGLRSVLDALRVTGSGRLVLVSSINVLGIRNLQQANEDAPCRRAGEPHADVKIDGENLAWKFHRQHGVDVTVLRPGMIYGSGEKNIPKLLDAVRRGKFAFIGSRENVVPMVHIDDMVQAMLLAAEKPAASGRTYHVTDGAETTIGELVELLAELTGCPKPEKTLPYWIPRLGCAVFELLALLRLRSKPAPITRVALRFLGSSRSIDIRRARTELGFNPQRAFHDTMAAYVRWLEKGANDESDVARITQS